MSASIKWRLIIINFILVFIAMVIVGFSIVERLETQQLITVREKMEQDMATIVAATGALGDGDWGQSVDEIQEVLNGWRLSGSDTLYVIINRQDPTIIASTVSTNEQWRFASAVDYQPIEPVLVIQGLQGQKGQEIIVDDEDTRYQHMTYPVLDSEGLAKGMLYMVSNLVAVDTTLQQAKMILTGATIIALLVTIILGYILASSITTPIRDVTEKAEEMAQGNFDQRVEVMSNDEIGQLAAMFNYLTRELKMSIERINLERNKLDTIFHYMAEGVLALDTEQHLIQANPLALRVLDLTEDDIDEVHPKLWEKLNLPKTDENTLMSAHGETRVDLSGKHYNVKYAPYRNEQGVLDGLIVVLQDVTKEHRLDTMRKDFVANVSHELKTPITTIKSYVETMMDYAVDEENRRQFLSVIDEESDRMSHLVTDLLALSNLDYRQGFAEQQEINVNHTVKRMLRRLEWLSEEKEQDVKVDMDRKVKRVIGNRDAIERAILNILSNAMKYTPEGGRIDVCTIDEGERVKIIIEDQGVGIPKEDQERIFERFYRVEKGRSRREGGTGLGLAIARENIRAHSGDILLKSTYGKGTKVTIMLPYEGVES